MAIGILGAVVKFLLDQHSLARNRADALNEFRKEILRRLVDAKNQVRDVPSLIEVDPSAKAYGEQMRALIGSRHDLSLIRHEIETSKQAFSNLEDLKGRLLQMEKHLGDLINEFKTHYRDLSKEQTETPDVVSPEIQSLPKQAGLRREDKASGYIAGYISEYKVALKLIREDIWAAVGAKTRTTNGT
jgi:hypothetical protein